MNEWIVVGIIIALWNIITFALYGADKLKARRKEWRISEATLILCAFLMGGAGALLGMLVFRHKTKHLKFRLLIPIAVIINILIAVLIIQRFDIFKLIGW